MHESAMRTGKAFFARYITPGDSILEVGSMNVNGTLRDACPAGSRYYGVDMSAGPGVDLVVSNPHVLPFDDGSFDIIVSSSAFEHDSMFWLTFKEMARVARKFIYLSAPVQGPVHNHPVDCWRFYPDAGLALAEWGRHNQYDIHLLESFILPKTLDVWDDFVAVFGKDGINLKGSPIAQDFSTAIERR